MEVGGELGLNFLPGDDETLRRMIQLEILEYSLMKEREGGKLVSVTNFVGYFEGFHD